MRVLSAAIFAASCLLCGVAGGIIGSLVSAILLRAAVIGPTSRLAVTAGLGSAVAFALLTALYLLVIHPERTHALHRLRLAFRRR